LFQLVYSSYQMGLGFQGHFLPRAHGSGGSMLVQSEHSYRMDKKERSWLPFVLRVKTIAYLLVPPRADGFQKPCRHAGR